MEHETELVVVAAISAAPGTIAAIAAAISSLRNGRRLKDWSYKNDRGEGGASRCQGAPRAENPPPPKDWYEPPEF
jgi:hypothetical protein